MRTTPARATAVAAASLLAIAMAPVVTDVGTAADLDPHVASTNVEFVASLAYDDTRRGAVRDIDTQGGTDVEVGSQLVLVDGEVQERDFAYAGTYQNGFYVVDVTDPEQPVEAGRIECDILQGDVQVMTREDLLQPNGLPRVFVTYAIDGSAGAGKQSPCFTELQRNNPRAAITANGGSLIFDVSDPAAITTVGFIPAPGSTHNGTIVSYDTDDDGIDDDWLFYNSENDAGGNLSIWDITDPTNAMLVQRMPLQGSGTDTHDVTFNADGTRAYVASITNSYILNTEDPRSPTLVSRIVDPGNGIHHQADPITLATPLGERTYVIISDEIAGAGGNGYCPGGGMHIWDVTVETAPVKVGAYFMPDIAVQEGANTGSEGLVSCTSHVFRLYPEQGIMTIGNMAGGVRVIDVSQLIGLSAGHMNTSTAGLTGVGMRDLGWWRFTGDGTDGSDSWSFKAHPDRFEEDGSFYAFSNDQTRGFEVYRFDGSAEVATPRAGQQAERGRMVSVQESYDRWASLQWRDDAFLYSCRFPGGIGGGLLR